MSVFFEDSNDARAYHQELYYESVDLITDADTTTAWDTVPTTGST